MNNSDSNYKKVLKIYDFFEKKGRGTGEGIPKQEGEELYSFIKEHNIKRVIETGVAFGVTTCWILAALPADGLLVSIESLPKERKETFVPPAWWSRWEIVPFPSQTHLSDVLCLKSPIDLFFHDSDHRFQCQRFEYETALHHVRFIGSHGIHLMGPVYAWDVFIKQHNLKVLIQQGQLGIAQAR